jgi:tetratricopeptide (TPR) repeat protein
MKDAITTRLSVVLFAAVAFLGCAVICADALWAQAPGQQVQVLPLTEKEIIDLLKKKTPAERLTNEVMQRGVDFDLGPESEKRLRKAKATPELLEAIKNQGPAARAARAEAGAPGVAPQEAEAFRAIQNELDPSRQIQMVEDFLANYPSSELLTWVHTFAASAYQQRGEIEKVVEHGDKSLELKPDNLLSLLIMCSMLPQPQLMKGSDHEKDANLKKAEDYAHKALELIEALEPQPNEAPETFAKRKAQLSAEPHSSLGLIYLERALMGLMGPDTDELAKAEAAYRRAISLVDRPNPQDYYRLGETLSLSNKLDEAVEAFQKAGELGSGTILKTYADQRIEAINKKRQGASP